MTVKIATAQYDISFLENWQAYQDKIERWVIGAVEQDAKILLFPEYFSMELASLFGQEVYSSLSKQLTALQSLHESFLDLFQTLADIHQCLIQSGTFPVQIGSGIYRNRAYLFVPNVPTEYPPSWRCSGRA